MSGQPASARHGWLRALVAAIARRMTIRTSPARLDAGDHHTKATAPRAGEPFDERELRGYPDDSGVWRPTT